MWVVGSAPWTSRTVTVDRRGHEAAGSPRRVAAQSSEVLGEDREHSRLGISRVRDRSPRSVVVITVDGRDLTEGFDTVHLECEKPFDLEILGHHWREISGPVTIEVPDGHSGNTWVTVRNGPAVVLAASPPSTSTLDIVLRGATTIVVDDVLHRLERPERVRIAFPTDTPLALAE